MSDEAPDLLQDPKALIQMFQALAHDVGDVLLVLLADQVLYDHRTLVRLRGQTLAGPVEAGLDLQGVLHRRLVVLLLDRGLGLLEVLLGPGHVQALLLRVRDQHLGDRNDLSELVLGHLDRPLGRGLGRLECGQELSLLELLPGVAQLIAEVCLDDTQTLHGVDPGLGLGYPLLDLGLGTLLEGRSSPADMILGSLDVLLVSRCPGLLQVFWSLAHVYLVGDELTDVLGYHVDVLAYVLLLFLLVLGHLLQLACVGQS